MFTYEGMQMSCGHNPKTRKWEIASDIVSGGLVQFDDRETWEKVKDALTKAYKTGATDRSRSIAALLGLKEPQL